MRLKGKRIAIIAEDLYEEMELWAPYYRLLEEGVDVVLVGTGAKEEYKGKHGYPAKVHTDAAKVSAADLDGVVVPGGFAPDRMRRYPAVLQLVRECDEQGKLVASICHGPWVLSSARILKGRVSTSTPAIRDDVENAGSEWVDQEVVVDRNLITSRHFDDIPAFNRAIVEWLTSH